MWPPVPGLEPCSHYQLQRRIPTLSSSRPFRGQMNIRFNFLGTIVARIDDARRADIVAALGPTTFVFRVAWLRFAT